jgi:hypothetical protein
MHPNAGAGTGRDTGRDGVGCDASTSTGAASGHFPNGSVVVCFVLLPAPAVGHPCGIGVGVGVGVVEGDASGCRRWHGTGHRARWHGMRCGHGRKSSVWTRHVAGHTSASPSIYATITPSILVPPLGIQLHTMARCRLFETWSCVGLDCAGFGLKTLSLVSKKNTLSLVEFGLKTYGW